MAKQKSREGYKKLKDDIKNGDIGRCYIFCGEEDYLRDYYLQQLEKRLVAEDFREFNYQAFEGGKLDLNELESAVDALPMLSERKMLVVKDYDLYSGGEKEREKVGNIIEELPDYVCLVFVYDAIEYKSDGRLKFPTQAIKKNALVVDFQRQGGSEMMSWVRRRFKSQGHDIDTKTTEYLMFICGGLMTNLAGEISKISAYAKQEIVTRADIDAVATPVVEAVAFDLTDSFASGDADRAMRTLGDLFLLREAPQKILAIVGSQLRSMYLVRLARENGVGLGDLTALLGYSSDYPTRRLLKAVEKRSAGWLRMCLKMCAKLDMELKSVTMDKEAALEMLIIKMFESGKVQ